MAGASNELRLVASIDLSRVTRSIRQLRSEIQGSLNESSLSSFNRGLATASVRAQSISVALRQTQVEARGAALGFRSIVNAIPTGRILAGLTAAFGFNELRRGFSTIEDASLRLQNVAGSAEQARSTVFALSRAASDAGLNFGQLSSQLIALQQVAASSGFNQGESLDLAANALRAGRALSGTSVQGTQAIIRNIERIFSQQRLGAFELRPLLFAGVQEREIFQALGVDEEVGRRLLASNTPIISGGQTQQVSGISADRQVQVTANEAGANLARILGDRLPADFQTLSGSFNSLRNSVGTLGSAIGVSTNAFPILTAALNSASQAASAIGTRIEARNQIAALVGDRTLDVARRASPARTAIEAQSLVAITNPSDQVGNQDLEPIFAEAIQSSGFLQRGESFEQFLARATPQQLSRINRRVVQALNPQPTFTAEDAQLADQQLGQVEGITTDLQTTAQENQAALGRRVEAGREQAAEELRREARNREAEIAIRGVSSAIGELTRSAIQARAPLEDILQQFLDTLLQTSTNALSSGINQSLSNILYPDKAASAIQQRATENAAGQSGS